MTSRRWSRRCNRPWPPGSWAWTSFPRKCGAGVEEIRQVSTQLAQIIHQVQTLTPRFQTVNEGMHAQATGAQQISETLTQLSEAAQQTAESLRQSNQAIEQLNGAARGLQASVARFKLATLSRNAVSVFQLGDDRYALEASRVVEVVPLLALKRLPQAPRVWRAFSTTAAARCRRWICLSLRLGQPGKRALSTRIIIVNYTMSAAQSSAGPGGGAGDRNAPPDARDFVDPGVRIGAAPYLGPVLMDARPIQWINEQRLLPEPVRELLFSGPVVPAMTQIEHLLRDRIGLDASSIGSTLIQRTVRLRMKSLGLKQLEEYQRLLETSATNGLSWWNPWW